MQKFVLPALIPGIICLGIICFTVLAANWVFGKMKCGHVELQIRQFVAERIEHNGDSDIVLRLLKKVPDYCATEVVSWQNVPWAALLPGYVLSEFSTTLDATFRFFDGVFPSFLSAIFGIVITLIVFGLSLLLCLFIFLFMCLLILGSIGLPSLPFFVVALGSIGLALAMGKRKKITKPQV